MSSVTAVPFLSAGAQVNQEPSVSVTLPSNGSLWGCVAFLGEHEIEVFVAGRRTVTVRGRFQAERLQKFEYRNSEDRAQRVSITARRVGEDALLPVTRVDHLGAGNPVLAFGWRSMPLEQREREGSYTYEVAIVGFTSYES